MVQYELIRYVITDDLLSHTYPWRVTFDNIETRKVWTQIIDWAGQIGLEYISHYGNCEFWFRSEQDATFFLLKWN